MSLWLKKQDATLVDVCPGPPIGTMIDWPNAVPPTGWLLCDGTPVAAATYPDLYAVIGITFGGDEVDFLLPNLSARSSIGADATYLLGVAGGSAAPSVAAHGHQVADHTHTTSLTGNEADADHQHFGTVNDGAAAHTHGPADNVSGAGENFVWRLDANPGGSNQIVIQEGQGLRLYYAGTATGSADASHTHTASIGEAASTHGHTIAGEIDPGGPDFTDDSAAPAADANYHPFLPLAKIIKAL